MMASSLLSALLLAFPLLSAEFHDDFNGAFLEGAPRFKESVEVHFSRYLGDILKLRCGAIGLPRPSVFWYRNNDLMSGRDQERLHVDDSNMILTNRRLEAQDQGAWHCVVRNRHGNITRNFTVDVVDMCDAFLLPETPVAAIPMECVCFWKFTNEVRRPDVNFAVATELVCTPYARRIQYDARRVLSHLPCVQQPCVVRAAPPEPATTGFPLAAGHVVAVQQQLPAAAAATPASSSEEEEEEVEEERPQGDDPTPPRGLRAVPLARPPPSQHERAGRRSTEQPAAAKQLHQRPPHASPTSSNARSTPSPPQQDDDESYEEEEEEQRRRGNNANPVKMRNAKTKKKKLSPERDNIEDDPAKRVAPSFVGDSEAFKTMVSPAGRTIKINCKAKGMPAPTYVWYKDEELLYHTTIRVAGGKYKVRGTNLEMEDVTESDSGVYRCAAYNTMGEIHRRYNISIVSRMRAPPLIVPNVLLNQTVTANGTATFKCRVISDLTPHIVWVKMEKMWKDAYQYYNETAGALMYNFTTSDQLEKARVTADGMESTLNITNVSAADAGLYVCISGNSMGKTMANATLEVNEFREIWLIPPDKKEEFGSIWLSLLSLFFFLVLLALIIAGILMLVQQKQQKRTPLKRRLMIVARRRNNGDDPKMYVGDLPSSYAVQIIEKDAKGQELKKRPRLNSDLTSFEDFEVETDPEWEIDRERLRLIEQLGEGAFGVVWRGVFKKRADAAGVVHEMPVAVKRLKDTAHQKELVDLFSEAQMFKIIGRHENVLGLVGCCTGAGPLFVVLELCEHGNLRDFLRAHRPKEEKEGPPLAAPEDAEYLQPKRKHYECVIKDLTQRHLVEWAWQVAKGMKYMSSLKIIHRDLAARNVLVTGNFVMKISDFGLSRDVYSANYYRRKGNGRLPIKWMALEALDSHVYTVESDVWSFGILLWEIMTLGGTPYPTIAMPQLYSCLKDGYRMESPHHCPEEIYNLMVACWQEKIENRPAFETIVDYFDWMLTESQRSEQSDGTTTHETTIDSETDKGSFSDSSDGTMETDANGAQRRVSRKSKMRPLSAPVLLPSEPAHEICDDDEDGGDWLPPSSPPPNQPVHSFVRPSPLSVMRAASTRSPPPPPLPFRRGDATGDEFESLIGDRADGPDSAIASPSGLDAASDYMPIYQGYNGPPTFSGLPTRDYMNVGERKSIFQPRRPAPPARFNFGNVTLKYSPGDKAATISGEGSSNLGFLPSPMAGRTNNSASCFSIMSESSGRGGSSAGSSAEGLGGINEFCQITYDRPPLKRQISSFDDAKEASYF